MCNRKKKYERPEYQFIFELENKVFQIFMTFSVLAMVISALYTVVDLIYYEQLKWIRDSVKPTVLLNFEIVAQTGAINAQDNLNSSINQLKISQAFF